MPQRREAAGWIALGVAGVVAVAIAVWLFTSGGDEGPGALASGDGAVPGTAAAGSELGVLASQRPEVGRLAPDFALLDARDGKTVRRLSDYRGKTVVLNWFATWCGPCRSEIPDFEAAYQALGGPDGPVEFLLVNLQESQSAAAGMLEELGFSGNAVLDSDAAVADHYRVTGMPTTFFIDKDGVIFNFGRGRVTAETLKSELAALGLSY